MRTARRFVYDESGVTLPLAMIMIVLIGVMGAGLLAFVNSDLKTVIEENRGQRAFEVADAGVGAAKRQLTSDCSSGLSSCTGHYDGGDGDIQWSLTDGGLTLTNLDGDGGTTDSVKVTIQYRPDNEDFRVISTGTYGAADQANRKIEAIFKGISAVGGGSGLGHPIYYTKSAIQIESTGGTQGITLDEISLFSEKDIIIQGLTTPAAFATDYADKSGGILKRAGGSDALNDWNSLKFTPPGDWNTRGRILTTVKNFGKKNESVQTDPFIDPGFAAEGKVCGTPGAPTPNCGTAASIADGVSSYDSTTGRYAPDGVTANASPRPVVLNSKNQDVAEKCTFMRKPFPANPPSDACYITYPFPRPTPKPDRLKDVAQQQDTPTDRHYWDVATDGTPQWDTLFPACTDPNGCLDRVVFVDGQNSRLDFTTSDNSRSQGILVVWCGDLQLNQSFKGIILNLYGDGSAFGASTCGPDYGVFRNNSQFCQCWLFADGGTDIGPNPRAGIQLAAGSTIKFVPGADWSFIDDLFENTPPTQFALRGWRECYKLNPQEDCT